jgi:ribonuclease HI
MQYYTDWACNPNPWIGWWWFVQVTNDKKTHDSWWWADETTNNRMELIAIIEALKHAKQTWDLNIEILSDSMLCVNTCSKWLFTWEMKGKIDRMKNPDLLRTILPLLKELMPKFTWVKAHVGNKWNEYADMLSNYYWSGDFKGL